MKAAIVSENRLLNGSFAALSKLRARKGHCCPSRYHMESNAALDRLVDACNIDRQGVTHFASALACELGRCRWLSLGALDKPSAQSAFGTSGQFRPQASGSVQLRHLHYPFYREEIETMVRDAGFVDVRAHHRHGYSCTVIGRKPG